METQLELLRAQALLALSEQDAREARLLAFDEGFAAPFVEAGYRVALWTPGGPWPGRQRFDLILGVGVAERAEDERESLALLSDRLADDGTLILAVPLALSGREPPEGALRHYAIEELSSLLLRSRWAATSLLANGPELVICELRRSNEVGAEAVCDIAREASRARWREAEACLSSMTEQMQSEELVREYAMLVGHVHMGRGRLGAALEAFRQAAELAEPSPLALTAMGAVGLSANDIEAALELFNAALELCPLHAPALRGLGVAQEARGDLEAALTSFDMAATQRPADRELAEKVVELGVKLGRAAPAAHAINRHVKRTGAQRWAARLLDRLDPPKARKSAVEQVATRPGANR